jgi:hypothetical protein
MHDKFNSSFSGFVKSKDISLSKDAIISELGFLVAHDRKNVVMVITHAGIPLPKKVTDEAVIHAIIENIGGNKKLQKGLAYMMVENNAPEQVSNFGEGITDWVDRFKTGTLSDEEKSKAGIGSGDVVHDASQGAKGLTAEQKGAVAGSVADAIGSIFGFLKANKEAKAQKETDKNQLLQALLMAKQGGGKKSNTALYVILAILGLGILGTVIYFAKKSKPITAPAA